MFADKAWPRDTDERSHLFLGLNYRMTELQAAVARAQLPRLAGVVEDRQRAAALLTRTVAGLDGLSAADPRGTVYWQFPIFIDPESAGGDAPNYARALAAEGIPANGGYIVRPLYLTPVFTERRTYGESGYPLVVPPATAVPDYAPGLCPNTEDLIDRRLLAIGWNENYSDDDVADIGAALSKVHAAKRP